jgi:hypothetical protein
MISYYFTVPPSKLIIENATPENRLLGTQGQDLTVSCKAEGGKPAPNVVLIIDGQTVANQTQTENSKRRHYTFNYSCLLSLF